jgi:hypothetical protein
MTTTTIAFPSVTAHLPPDAVRRRSSREILSLVRGGLGAVLAAPRAANDDAVRQLTTASIPLSQ